MLFALLSAATQDDDRFNKFAVYISREDMKLYGDVNNSKHNGTVNGSS